MTDAGNGGPPEGGERYASSNVTVDLARRMVVIEVRKPLELSPTRVDVPIAAWKRVAAAIIAAEADGELAAARPRIV